MINRIISTSVFFFFINFSFAQNMFNENGEREGIWIGYHSNGQLKFKFNFKDGEENGFYQRYHSDVQLDIKGNFKDGEKDGLWEFYHKNGQSRLSYRQIGH